MANSRKIFLHLTVWSLMAVLILFLAPTGPPPGKIPRPEFGPPPIFGLFFIMSILAYYLNTRVLIPKLLDKKRTTQYISSVLCLIAPVMLISIYGRPIFHFSNHKHPPEIIRIHFLTGLLVMLIPIAVGLGEFILQKWLTALRQKNEAELEKTRAELSLLKSQVNPHFLFNTLNNLYSLALSSSESTADAILKLSGIMRYLIDMEGQSSKVAASQEIECIRQYIDLQKLRISENHSIQFNIEGNPDSFLIEPLLMLPLVENAFKYGIAPDGRTKILIQIEVNENHFHLKIENGIFRSGNIFPGLGTGIKNLRKRLDLLYPSSSSLNTKEENSQFTAELKLW
jgi:two-component system LytT family sensor kinase